MMRRYRRRYGASRKGQIQPRMGMRPAGEPAGGQGIRIGTLRGVNERSVRAGGKERRLWGRESSAPEGKRARSKGRGS